MIQGKFNQAFVLLLLLFISAVFLAMVWPFLMTIIMAAIFAALARPLYRWLMRRFGGRRSLAAAVTLLLIVFVVLLPLAGLIGAVTGEAIKVGETVKPWVQKQLSQPAEFSELLKEIPFYDRILPYKETILLKAGELVGRFSSFLINSLSSVTVMTAQFIFMLFIFLYTMFFFLVDGRSDSELDSALPPVEAGGWRAHAGSVHLGDPRHVEGRAVIGMLQGALIGSGLCGGRLTERHFLGDGDGGHVDGAGRSARRSSGCRRSSSSPWAGTTATAIGLLVFCILVVGGVENSCGRGWWARTPACTS